MSMGDNERRSVHTNIFEPYGGTYNEMDLTRAFMLTLMDSCQTETLIQEFSEQLLDGMFASVTGLQLNLEEVADRQYINADHKALVAIVPSGCKPGQQVETIYQEMSHEERH